MGRALAGVAGALIGRAIFAAFGPVDLDDLEAHIEQTAAELFGTDTSNSREDLAA